MGFEAESIENESLATDGGKAMGLLKAMLIAAVVTGCVAIVVGTQGSTGGQLKVHPLTIHDVRVFWSWPLFLAGSGLSWGLILLQK